MAMFWGFFLIFRFVLCHSTLFDNYGYEKVTFSMKVYEKRKKFMDQ